MKKRYEFISTIVFILIILFFSIAFLIYPKKTISAVANRSLQSMPKFKISALIDGTYISKTEDYFNDHFIFRNQFINLKTSVSKILLKDEINNIYFGKNDYLIEKHNNYEDKDKLIKVLNNFYKKINYVNLNLLLVPTSISVNSEFLPNLLKSTNELDDINYIYDQITFNKIRVYDELNNSSYQTFYKTDHHWTSYGAYIAYVKYASKNNITPISIQEFNIKEVTSGFCGTLCSKTGDYNHINDSIYTFTYKDYNLNVNYVSSKKETNSLYEESYLNKKDKYSIFLDNNHPLIIITNNDIISKKEIVVIKDSYANSFIPFLVNHFYRVHVIDPRYYKLSISDYIKNNPNIMDTIILYNMDTIDEDTGVLSID